ncbi:hypothetical protein Aperf_G00000073541 [Anoplocephala perfoliata]
MSSYRHIVAITVVSASLFYAWYRYYSMKRKALPYPKQAVTQLALGSLLCFGKNPFRKRKKKKGKGKAPRAKATTSNEIKAPESKEAETEPSEMESRVQPNVDVPPHVFPPVPVESAAPEFQCHTVAPPCEALIEGNLNFPQNSVKLDPVVIPEITHINSPETIRIASPEIQVDAPELTPSKITEPIKREESITPGVDSRLSSSRENIRSGLDESGLAVVNSTVEEPVQVNEEEMHADVAQLTAQVSEINILDPGTKQASDKGPAVGLEPPLMNFGFLNPNYRGLRPTKTGMFDDPENHIEEVNPEYIDGVWIPKVLIPHEFLFNGVDPNMYVRNFDVPAYMSGVIIGRSGKNVTELKKQFSADISLSPHETDQFYLTLRLCCPKEKKDEVVNWILRRIRSKPSLTSIGNPNQLQRTLPLGQLTRVYVRSMYAHKQMYVTICDSIYQDFLKMQVEMSADYANLSTPRMSLYEPITLGTIAVLETNAIYSRVVIVRVMNKSSPKEAMCFLLDHGIFYIAPLANFRKIRAKYMQVPFQAVQVSWAHAAPNFLDTPDLFLLKNFFKSNQLYVYPVRMESCCRADVVFLEKVDTPDGSRYEDILVKAVEANIYHTVAKVISVPEQLELNRSDKPYYFCPYSKAYDKMVFYYNSVGHQFILASDTPDSALQISDQHEQQRQQDQLFDLQQQQRKAANQQNRQKAPANANGGAAVAVNGGKPKQPQNHHNGRRGRNRQQNQRNPPHQQQAKIRQSQPIDGSAKPGPS